MTKEVEKIIRKVQNEADTKSGWRFKGMMEVINDNFKKVAEQFKGAHEKLDSHTEEISNLTMDMMEVKSDVKTIKFEMVAVMDTKADRKHIVDLDHRTRTLEKK